MPFILRQRNQALSEWMDDPHCDQQLLFKTYEQFSIVNRLLSNWKHLYRTILKERLNRIRTFKLLDIGFGGGDILLDLDQCFKKDGFDVEITGIETDQRALRFVEQQSWPDSICFENISLSKLVKEDRHFDFIISNHLLHHLNNDELKSLLTDTERLCDDTVIFNDIERGDLGYLMFHFTTSLLFPSSKSFLNPDGRISIKRSFTKSELRSLVPSHWQVKRLIPYRLLLLHQKQVS